MTCTTCLLDATHLRRKPKVLGRLEIIISPRAHNQLGGSRIEWGVTFVPSACTLGTTSRSASASSRRYCCRSTLLEANSRTNLRYWTSESITSLLGGLFVIGAPWSSCSSTSRALESRLTAVSPADGIIVIEKDGYQCAVFRISGNHHEHHHHHHQHHHINPLEPYKKAAGKPPERNPMFISEFRI
jgi:hypothetical protein